MSAQAMANKKPDKEPYLGADAVISSLKAQGVEVVFGMVGGQIMPVYDALYRDGSILHIIVGHEQGAAHMAEGYARASGRPGVVMTTSGPGATNLVTGLADAFMDSTPMVAITGQVPSTMLGNDAFQEADMRGITMPITKHNYVLANSPEIGQIFAEAFLVAQTGRPGPVLLDIPRDLALAPCLPGAQKPSHPVGYKPPYKGHPLQIERALAQIKQAERPVILAGGGILSATASPELMRFASAAGIPVTTTLMGLSAFPSDHDLFLGMPGMHGTGYANLAIHNSDCLVVVGCRLDDRVTGQLDQFCPNAKLIHIDVDASEIGKNLTCHVPIVGDAKPVLKEMAVGAEAWDDKPDYSAWHAQIAEWKAEFPMVYPETEGVIAPQRVIQMVGDKMPDDAVIVTGVGQHQMFTAQYYPFKKPRTFITSGGLGTMGFGLPAAIGAKIAKPGSPCVLFDGDGSFLMTIQELATAVRYKVPVVCCILNNSYLGMVRQWQEMFYGNRLSQSDLMPAPYDKVAQAFGAHGRKVEKPEEVSEALDWAFEMAERDSLPVVLDIMVEPEASVLPMVPPGAPNKDFLPCEGCREEEE